MKHISGARWSARAIAVLSLVLLAGFAGSAAAQVGNHGAMTNPNLASADDLAKLPHISEELAAAIIEGRPYLDPASLDWVLSSALTGDQKAELYGVLSLPMNLNTASRDDIMRIPGMTGRMAHEFEEYRPYTSMDQFRREIGKYVDEAEVARFEQYVFAPLSLNDASEADLATIPGMSAKMVHEFEEYRPYANIEQFRREIGKYVDENEVARLERYITLD